MEEVADIARKYAECGDKAISPCISYWSKDRKEAAENTKAAAETAAE
tara:strand:- start:171 stop:311 length:141 start_codon:yes stop_codon:yes gene_type:complete